MRRVATVLVPILFAVTAHALAQAGEAPRTVPERTDYAETSRARDVEAFLDACLGLPHGDRLEVRVAGRSHEGRGILLVRAALADDRRASAPERLRALVIANIHAGEVEGKEAVQELLREVANGEHTDLLEHCELWCVPIYNVDGNEAIKVGNRRGQNGPDAVGQRHNAQNLDLNRDFVKADAAETRVLLKLFQEVDPHLFLDLHTTNGSRHGYHLTYAPSLSPNVDRDVDRLARDLLERARTALHEQGFEVFDYGNFETRDWDGGGAPNSPAGQRGWYTYDHRPRYGVNYFGLRNRVAVLSEAYSYDDFRTRIAATRAFVLAVLRQLVAERATARATFLAADARMLDDNQPVWFGSDTKFAEPEHLPVLVGEVERVARDGDRPLRYARTGTAAPETMPVYRRFRADRLRRLPRAWAVLDPSAEVVQLLRRHGIEFEALDQPGPHRGQRFAVHKKRKPKRPYQGHHMLVLDGAWQPPTDVELPLGTIVVPARQRLGRLAAALLEPESEDSLSTWNFFEQQTDDVYPAVRLLR